MSKLTERDVREIRARYAAGGVSHVQLAADYDVSTGTIGPILRGVTWRHLLSQGGSHA